MKCEICEKRMLFGHNVSHSKRHTRKISMPNIHKIKAEVEGKAVRLHICTRCLRTQNKLVQSAE
ncbi:MAG: 50S ribosomal protein L28 [Dehalococcoidales bacterium]|nr:50S ribosomal protein L28 [Dehalococcoidales bacterium]